MGVAFVILGAISFGLGYGLIQLEETATGVTLFIMSCALLIGAIIIDEVGKLYKLLAKRLK